VTEEDRQGVREDLRVRSIPSAAGSVLLFVAERIGDDISTLLRTYAHVNRKDDDR